MAAMGFLSACRQAEDTVPTPDDAAAAAPYPLNVCIVSGDELGSMGEPVVVVHEGQQVKFCCKDCIKEFESDPSKFLIKLKPGGQVENEL
jgi:hypothetical protein